MEGCRVVVVACVVVGCWSAPTSSPPAPAVAPVVLAVATGREVRVVEISPAGTRVLRTGTAPGPIAELDWVGDDPVVFVQRTDLMRCGLPAEAYDKPEAYEAVQRECDVDPAVDGTIGRITATGFVTFPRLPATTWAALPEPANEASRCRTGCWQMIVTGTGEVWEGHCKESFSADGSEICQTRHYARIDHPGPTAPDAPARAAGYTLAAIAPSRHVAISFAPTKTPDDDADPSRRAIRERPRLTCAVAGVSVSYPVNDDDVDVGMARDVDWLATEPPLFAAWHLHDGFTGYRSMVLFDRCQPHPGGRLVAGPGGLVAIVQAEIEVRRNGTLVGKTAGGSHIAFAPR